jgi:predicted CXXCH cytochrome family protein
LVIISTDQNEVDMKSKSTLTALISGLVVGLVAMTLTTGLALASPPVQEDDPAPLMNGQDCRECHLDITDHWTTSAHANAYDDPFFQERWTGMGNPGDCLACHTTNYVASTGEFTSEGVSCEACHGNAEGTHPPDVIPTRADTEYCGTCHTTTLSEWKKTGHATSDVGCMDCHDPHSQDPLFENPDDLCLNCHREDMGDYLNDLHVTKDIGCVDCHALVIPPDPIPDDGIVPTGHAFDITPQTCVACHTDALHAGFTLPGYEHGAAEADPEEDLDAFEDQPVEGGAQPRMEQEEETLNPTQRIQALETALASARISNLFQGAVIGLVLGGSTAWIVARNVRGEQDEVENQEVDHG